VLDDLFRCLTPREQRMVALRYDEDLTQREIGKRLGVSQTSVSRDLRAALPRLWESAESNARAG
jgi:RNA polymerase sigma factor (sigma-70 family)